MKGVYVEVKGQPLIGMQIGKTRDGYYYCTRHYVYVAPLQPWKPVSGILFACPLCPHPLVHFRSRK